MPNSTPKRPPGKSGAASPVTGGITSRWGFPQLLPGDRVILWGLRWRVECVDFAMRSRDMVIHLTRGDYPAQIVCKYYGLPPGVSAVERGGDVIWGRYNARP